MASILLGLWCSLAWGGADFRAGLVSRRAHPAWVAALSQGAGLIALLALLAVLGAAPPATSAMMAGLAAGGAGGLGLVALYAALGRGMMSLVVPVSGLGVAVPVVVGLLRGERPSALTMAGIVLGVAGVALATRAPGPAPRRGVGLAVLAAVSFGAFFTLLARAAEGDAVWAATTARVASVPLIVLGALLIHAPPRLGTRDRAGVVTAGLLDASATTAFALASQRGPLTLVAVLAPSIPSPPSYSPTRGWASD